MTRKSRNNEALGPDKAVVINALVAIPVNWRNVIIRIRTKTSSYACVVHVGFSYLQSRCYITSANPYNPNMHSIKILSLFNLRFVSHLITLFCVSTFNLTMKAPSAWKTVLLYLENLIIWLLFHIICIYRLTIVNISALRLKLAASFPCLLLTNYFLF